MSASPMYKMASINVNGVEDLPTCMYKMKNIYTANFSKPDAANDHSSSTAVSNLAARQDAIITRLESLKSQVELISASVESTSSSTPSVQSTSSSTPSVESLVPKPADVALPKDLVISCNPLVPARAVLYLIERLKADRNILCTVYTHSSIQGSPCLDLLKTGFQNKLAGIGRGDKEMVITWIWKDCEECEMMVSPIRQVKISNEANICRYLMRLLHVYPTSAESATTVDQWLDFSTTLVTGSNSEISNSLAKLSKHLAKSPYIAGQDVGIEDVVVCSAFIRAEIPEECFKVKVLKPWSVRVKNQFVL